MNEEQFAQGCVGSGVELTPWPVRTGEDYPALPEGAQRGICSTGVSLLTAPNTKVPDSAWVWPLYACAGAVMAREPQARPGGASVVCAEFSTLPR